MKNVFIIIATLLILFSLQSCSAKSSIKPGDPAPYTYMYMANGGAQLLSHYKGKTVAVMFWATWCNFSKYAMDDFNEKAVEYNNREDLVFLAVNLDDSREDFDERVKVRKYNNVIHGFSGNGQFDETYLRFGSPSIPIVFTIGPDGIVKNVAKRFSIE